MCPYDGEALIRFHNENKIMRRTQAACPLPGTVIVKRDAPFRRRARGIGVRLRIHKRAQSGGRDLYPLKPGCKGAFTKG